MKLIIFTTLFMIFVVLLLPAFLSLGIRYIPFGIQPPLDRVESIQVNQVITQDFTADKDRLTGFAMSIKNPYLRNKKDLILYVYDGLTPIRVSKLNGQHIQDGEYVKFIFEPIPNSLGKSYQFSLTTPDSTAADSLQVFYTAEKQPNMGELKVTQQEVPGFAISFVGLYKPASVLAPLIEIYRNWLIRFTEDTGFFVVYIILIIALSGNLIFSVTRKTRE